MIGIVNGEFERFIEVEFEEMWYSLVVCDMVFVVFFIVENFINFFFILKCFLFRKKLFVLYCDFVLIFFFKDSLGGNFKIVMVVG